MKPIRNVLVVFPMNQESRNKLCGNYPSLAFHFAENPTREEVQGADVIFGNPDPELIRGTRLLQWIQLNSAGADQYLEPGLLPDGALLTNATGAYGLTISEHLMGVLLMLTKKLHLLRDHQNKGIWQNAGRVKTLMNATVLVLGAGNIGTEFAKRVKAFGSYVIGVRRTPGEKPDCYDEMYLMKDLDSVLPRVDAVVMALPGTPETTHIIGKERLALMKDDAVLLNVGRGSAIDTEALCDALEAGKFWGVGVDVTDPEPLPEGHRLWEYPNVVITPHCAGGFGLDETKVYIAELFERNLEKLLAGETLENIVDFATGYRKR